MLISIRPIVYDLFQLCFVCFFFTQGFVWIGSIAEFLSFLSETFFCQGLNLIFVQRRVGYISHWRKVTHFTGLPSRHVTAGLHHRRIQVWKRGGGGGDSSTGRCIHRIHLWTKTSLFSEVLIIIIAESYPIKRSLHLMLHFCHEIVSESFIVGNCGNPPDPPISDPSLISLSTPPYAHTPPIGYVTSVGFFSCSYHLPDLPMTTICWPNIGLHRTQWGQLVEYCRGYPKELV